MDAIGSRLREERLRLGFTLREFSALGGISANALQIYKKGKRAARGDFFAAIGRCGADITYICVGTHVPLSKEGLTNTESEVVKQYRNLDTCSRQAIDQILLSLSAVRLTDASPEVG